MQEYDVNPNQNSPVEYNPQDYKVKSENLNKGQFSYFTTPITNTTPTEVSSIEKLFEIITESKELRDNTTKCRVLLNNIGKKEYSDYKSKNLPFVTISGIFKKRELKSLIDHSGYICIDVDDLIDYEHANELKSKIATDKHLPAVMIFISPSGHGVKIIYRINTNHQKQKETFEAISNYFQKQYGIVVDRSGSDVSRACFLSYDEKAYLHQNHQDLEPINDIFIAEWTEQDSVVCEESDLSDKEIEGHVSTLERYAKALDEQGRCITEDYNDWLRIGLSLCHLAEHGRDLFHKFSSSSLKYNEKECDAKYDDLLSNYDGRLTIGTIYHYLRDVDVQQEPKSTNHNIRSASKRLQDAMYLPDIQKQLGVIWMNGELHVLFGDTGCGKSVFAVQIADALSKGKGVFSVLPNENPLQKVLLYDFELSDKQFFKRYTDENKTPYQFNDNLVFGEIDFKQPFLSGDKIPMDKYIIKRLREDIKTFKPQILIVDNITYLTTQAAQDTSVALELMRELDDIKKEFNISILVLAHTPKVRNGSPLTLNELGGSKHISNFADSVSCIGKSSDGNNVRYIKQVKPSRSAELVFGSDNVIVVELNKKGSRLAFDYIDCTFEADHLNFTAPSERKDEWFDTVMAMHRDGASVRGIAKETGVPKSTVGRWVNNNGSQLQGSI